MTCLLCAHPTHFFSKDPLRSYVQCSHCELVFVPRAELISVDEEKIRYNTHQVDAGYRSYLSAIRDTVIPHVQNGPGLDFGCGLTTMLADLFQESGIKMESYDLFYRPEENIWNQKFSFIVLSEVVEHLRDPLGTMKRLDELLLPGGKIFLKTKFLPEHFENWYYKRDLTHVQFFNPASMQKLAEVLGKKPSFLAGDVSLIADDVEIVT